MKYILLDTCVLVNCTLMNAPGADPELLVSIVDRMRGCGARLLLPEVVRLEFARKAPEELSLIKQQTKKFRDSITTSVLPAPDVSMLHEALDRVDADRDAAAERAQGYFAGVASDPDIVVPIALDGDVVAEAIGYVLAGQKPSKGAGYGLVDADSLIIASVARFARAQGLSLTDRIVICSDNHKDFARWDQEHDSHVAADSIAAAIPCEVGYYKSPRLLLENELEVVVEAGKPLSDALDDYDQWTDTMSSISSQLRDLDYLKSMSVPTVDPAFLESIKRITTIDPAVTESIRRITVAAATAMTVDPVLLQSIKRITTIDPAVSESISRIAAMAMTVDSKVMESFKRMTAIDPAVSHRIRNLGIGSDDLDGKEQDD